MRASTRHCALWCWLPACEGVTSRQTLKQCLSSLSPSLRPQVYLIHPLVVTPVTALVVWAYGTTSWAEDHPIVFRDPQSNATSTTSSSVLAPADGVAPVLALGWLVANLLSQAIVWPLAALVRQLPGLRQVL